MTSNALESVGEIKIWLTSLAALFLDQHWPMCPLRTPVLVKPQDTWQSGTTKLLAANMARKWVTAACSQLSRVE